MTSRFTFYVAGGDRRSSPAAACRRPGRAGAGRRRRGGSGSLAISAGDAERRMRRASPSRTRCDDPRTASTERLDVCGAPPGQYGSWPPRQCWTLSRRRSPPSETRERSPTSRSPSARSPTGWKTSRCPARVAPGNGSRSSPASPRRARRWGGWSRDTSTRSRSWPSSARRHRRTPDSASGPAEPGSTSRRYASSAGWHLEGVKPYASGANELTHALITARDGADRLLFLVPADGWTSRPGTWQAVGMAGSDSPTVDVSATLSDDALVGAPGSYLARPGFWHGGLGVAAVWHGGAVGVAAALRLAADTPRCRRTRPRTWAASRWRSPLPRASCETAPGRSTTTRSTWPATGSDAP